jgi:hypothetical protein
MSNTVSGGFVACHYPSKQGPIGGLLWKTTATLVGTSLSIEPGNLVDGVVTDVWLDPGTLKATATIKGYMQDDDLSTPTYFLDYTVPNPAVETRAALNARLRVHGKLQIDIAGATAADTVVIYVFVDPHADTGVILVAATDGTYIGDIKFGESLPSGTALMGKVGIDQVTANANEVVLKAGTALAGKFGIDQATANANEVVVKSGEVTANLGTTDNAVLDAIALAVATEGDALGDGVLMQGDDGTDRTNVLVDTDGHLQVDALTLPALPAGTNLIGDVDVPYAPENLVPNSTQADQALTVDATEGGVPFAAFHADTTHVELDVQDAQIRYTVDGSAPTSSNGHILNPYARRVWPKTKAAAAKFIRTGSTSAIVHASQLKGA